MCVFVVVRFNDRRVLVFMKQRRWNETLTRLSGSISLICPLAFSDGMLTFFCSSCGVSIPTVWLVQKYNSSMNESLLMSPMLSMQDFISPAHAGLRRSPLTS